MFPSLETLGMMNWYINDGFLIHQIYASSAILPNLFNILLSLFWGLQLYVVSV
jgi:hypothetical protein